ncbi:MAG: F0F1 ATP synthase subunit B [Patescibacteria group bacterium]|jgi:F-type H+-transporting ATPase subunit b
MEILQLFGVDWKLMLAQIFNFAIVAFVLWRFAIKPVMANMEKRNQEIEQGLKDAEKSTQKLAESDREIRKNVQETQAKAMQIIMQAKKDAEAEKHTQLEKTKEEVKHLIDKAKEQIASQQEEMILQAKAELAETVVETVRLVMDNKMNKDIDKKYIDSMLKKV